MHKFAPPRPKCWRLCVEKVGPTDLEHRRTHLRRRNYAEKDGPTFKRVLKQTLNSHACRVVQSIHHHQFIPCWMWEYTVKFRPFWHYEGNGRGAIAGSPESMIPGLLTSSSCRSGSIRPTGTTYPTKGCYPPGAMVPVGFPGVWRVFDGRGNTRVNQIRIPQLQQAVHKYPTIRGFHLRFTKNWTCDV